MRKAAMNIVSLWKRMAAGASIVVLTLLGVAHPAAALAPQPIDASEQGPLAFVAMTVMIVIFVFTLFYMDRIRKRADERDQPQP